MIWVIPVKSISRKIAAENNKDTMNINSSFTYLRPRVTFTNICSIRNVNKHIIQKIWTLTETKDGVRKLQC